MSEALYLYFDTIRLINRRLIEHDMSDELMLAIATVALFEVAAQVPYPNVNLPLSSHPTDTLCDQGSSRHANQHSHGRFTTDGEA